MGAKPETDVCSIDTVLRFIHSDDRLYMKQRFLLSIRDRRKGFSIDHRVVRADTGEVRVVHERCVHSRDESGSLIRTRGMIHDITDRHAIEKSLRAALEEKSVLLHEVNHRVRNNLSVVESLLNLELEQLPAGSFAYDVLNESHRRIASMALVHDQMYQSNNFSEIDVPEYVETLLNGIRESYKDPRVELKSTIEAIKLDITKSIPCGMILNELVVNAYKHAFPERGGTINVQIRRRPDRMIELKVRDDGIGSETLFEGDTGCGLGCELVRQLTQQINGTLTFSGTKGAEITIAFSK